MEDVFFMMRRGGRFSIGGGEIKEPYSEYRGIYKTLLVLSVLEISPWNLTGGSPRYVSYIERPKFG